jgi:hypothetical protein
MPLNPRQTDLSLKDICMFLKNRSPAYPRCLLANELGAMAQDDKQAEAELQNLLSDENSENVRCAAYGSLSIIRSPDPETMEALKRFRKNSDNIDLVAYADERNKVLLSS